MKKSLQYFCVFAAIMFCVLTAFCLLDFSRQHLDIGFVRLSVLATLKTVKNFYNLFPMILLMSCTFFFYRLVVKNELSIMQHAGISYTQFLSGLSLTVMVIFAFDMFFMSRFAAYAQNWAHSFSEHDTPVVLTNSGIWVRTLDRRFINAQSVHKSTIQNVRIIDFDDHYNFKKMVVSHQAEIKDGQWFFEDARLIESEMAPVIVKNYTIPMTISAQDLKRLYMNAPVPFWKIHRTIRVMEKMGLSATELKMQWMRMITKPFYWMSMIVCSFSLFLFFNSMVKLFVAMLSMGIILFFISELLAVYALAEKINAIVAFGIVPLLLSFTSIVALKMQR